MKPPQRIRYIVLACRISPNATEDQCRSVAAMFDSATVKATLLREGSAVYEVTTNASIEQVNAVPEDVIEEIAPEDECPYCLGRLGRIVSSCEDCQGSGRKKA